MLRSLYIHNIAIIDKLEVELHENMTSITGETGAGKSIIIDSLALALGARAEQSLISNGQDKAQVIAEFDISEQALIQDWLEEHELSSTEASCLLQRSLYREKPSKSLINGHPVSVQTLKELGDKLVSICGQQEHLTLTRPLKQLEILDEYAQMNSDLAISQTLYQRLRTLNNEIKLLENTDAADVNELNMLHFLINELEEGKFDEHEYQQLDEEQSRLAHATEIAEAVNTGLSFIKDNEINNISGWFNQINQKLKSVEKYESKLSNIIELIDNCNALCEEAVNELNALSTSLDFDPGRLAETDQRLGQYHDMARKHRTQAGLLGEKLDALKLQLERIDQQDQILEKLKIQQQKLRKEYQTHADLMHDKRHKSATKLSRAITIQMQELGLKGALFNLQCTQDKDKISAKGQDTVRFLVATNPSQPAQAIEKIASGGELSRISLALQLEITRLENAPVLIFDEVDTGISGQTADIIGSKLRSLSLKSQVICITHLPQVASKGHHQLKISKTSGKHNQVELTYLPLKQRINELARMLSGADITEESLANARVMLAQTIK